MLKAKNDGVKPMEMLSEVVSISRQFLRSIRIDSDIGREDALQGYVCQSTAQALIENIARQIKETRQRAFTWTGPYGGGKSSLALLLCSLVGKNRILRKQALRMLNADNESPIHSVFSATGSGWLIVPMVGKRALIQDEVAKALALAKGESVGKRKASTTQDVIGDLVSAANQHPQGVLVLIDEMGKLLEAASQEGGDLHFFQDLAEAASRATGKLIVIGILHQSFEAYATRLGREARDEWAKVQGRYIDMPMVAAVDEVIELVGRAIESRESTDKGASAQIASAVASAIIKRRPITPPSITAATQRCWPLHPVVATLLGPISRRRFSQNERSTFGFLASREPLGFMEFLETTPTVRAPMYTPARYWDYLRANLDQAILASPDGHRWAVAVEAVERAEAKGTQRHIELAKSVALIELFRGGSGLVPEFAVLNSCISDASPNEVKAILHDLIAWKILIERKHLSAFGVFSGSDFDIDGAIGKSVGELGSPDLQQLSALMDMQPIVAKRTYSETGTMRWFVRRLIRLEDLERDIEHIETETGSAGTFLLCLPDLGISAGKVLPRLRKLSDNAGNSSLILGVPENADRIAELSSELFACEHVFKTRTELDGDSVARKELLGRIGAIRATLEDELGDAFGLSKWYWQGTLQNSPSCPSISSIASKIAQERFHTAPRINNELINRERPSGNSIRARKDLMYRMLTNGLSRDLDYSGFPADRGLYVSILKQTGLHRERPDGQFNFGEPYCIRDEQIPIGSLWAETSRYMLAKDVSRRASELYDLWSKPPYGIRQGIMPVLALAFFLENRSTLALYLNGVFTSELTEVVVDEWLLDPSCISFSFVSASTDKTAYLRAVAACVPGGLKHRNSEDPLEVARSLVGLVVSLPNWTKRTSSISSEAQSVRAMLLKASDPIKVLFSDLPILLGEQNLHGLRSKLKGIVEEFRTSYLEVLAGVKESVLVALDQADGDYSHLQTRAKVIKGIAGEFRLEAFVTRLESFDGSHGAIESLISLATGKVPSQFVDRDIDVALLQLATWSHDFRRAETIAPLRGRPSTRRAIGIVFGAGRGVEASTSIDIDSKDAAAVSHLASQLIADLQSQSHEIAIAALAEAGALLLKAKQREEVK